jgi:hypothetical protein
MSVLLQGIGLAQMSCLSDLGPRVLLGVTGNNSFSYDILTKWIIRNNMD